MKKIIVGLLAVTGVGVTGVGVYDAAEGNTIITAEPVQDKTVFAKVAAIVECGPDDQVQARGATGGHANTEMQVFAAEWTLPGVVTGNGDAGQSADGHDGTDGQGNGGHGTGGGQGIATSGGRQYRGGR